MLRLHSRPWALVLMSTCWCLIAGCSDLPEISPDIDARAYLADSGTGIDSGTSPLAPDMGAPDGSPDDMSTHDRGVELDGAVGVDMEAPSPDVGRPAPIPDASAPLPPTPPRFDSLSTVLDLAAPDQRIWAHLIYIDRQAGEPRFVHQSYRETGAESNFWPASTIKMYTATAALVLLSELNVSIDASATFYRETNGRWVEDITLSFRELIHRTFNCSSNETYTLLLRFAGLDWLNDEFFVAANGFERTALMRGYVTADARPYAFIAREAQRIVVREGGRELTREHRWSGRPYANDRDCTVYNGSGTANCTTPRDMSEHLRRIILHEELPVAERFQINEDALAWYRGAGPERVLNNTAGNNCGGPAYAGVLKVFPDPVYHHKGGTVREYRSTIQHVQDPNTGAQYTAAIAVQSGSGRPLEKASEELARMVKTPGLYVHLASLRDHVNPVRADLVVVSDEPGRLELVTKPYAEDGLNQEGWSPMAGTSVEVRVGETAHSLRSVCLDRSEQVHIRGRLQTESGRVAWSDLHYVIVDHTQPCQDP